MKRSYGLLVPLFSVYSRDSLGIGEFTDMKYLIDWAVSAGCSVVQLLPMNELGSVNCPYDSISSFALEPAYISVKRLVEEKGLKYGQILKDVSRKYSLSGPVDYNIRNEKQALLWEIFNSDSDIKDREFKKFVKDNAYWIEDYALYKELKFLNNGSAWYDWEEGSALKEDRAIKAIKKERAFALDFHKWVQWIAYIQFHRAAEYARSKGVKIKGDLPILVSRDSADVWANRQYFKLDLCAGAPPDMYAAKGQRWGMPTYDWNAIRVDDYSYLRNKLRYAGNFYDILRVDHVVGLFRIWSIPQHTPQEEQGLNGFFDPAEQWTWEEHGRNILKIMQDSTSMELCAEDLGTVPDECAEVLKELSIPGNDVQRWMKDWDVSREFLPASDYRQMAVAMLSTHDTTPWAAWWEHEAGTVDQALFERKCHEYGLDYNRIKDQVFDVKRSGHGRLRWKKEIDSVDAFLWRLERPFDSVAEIVQMYIDTYGEREKLWHLLGMKGKVNIKASAALLEAVFLFNAQTPSVLCIESIVDWLILGGILEGDYYTYRINTPGTVSSRNWSFRMPLPLEKLVKHPVKNTVYDIVKRTGRK